MNPTDIPRLDQPPPDPQPRALQFDAAAPGSSRRRGFLGRRGFVAVLAGGAMTLGMTVLGWIPLARPARAEAGTEYPDCGRYSDGPGGPICIGAPYSPAYCGADDWFITGCYDRPEGRVCYEAAKACRASRETRAARNAWRWVADGITYRCADGHAWHDGSPNPEVLICSARLTGEPSPSPAPPPPTTSPPPTSPRPWPWLSELPVLPP